MSELEIDLEKEMRAQKTFGIKCLAFHTIKRDKVLLDVFILTGGFDSAKDLYHAHVSELYLVLQHSSFSSKMRG